MARRTKASKSVVEPREWQSTDEINRAIKKLKRRIGELENLDIQAARAERNSQDEVAISNVREVIREVFGSNSPEFNQHEHIRLWAGPMFMNMPDHQTIQAMELGRTSVIGKLNGLIGRLEEKLEDLPAGDASESTYGEAPVADLGRQVFVVHGHDEAAKESVARFLESLDLDPLILHEQPNQGRTIIEKFEDHADVGFAVVILTSDDVGGLAGKPDEQSPRARQNVVFELGYFVGKLGRSRVCALHRSGVEILSDYEGVAYVPLDDQNGWRLLLAREIKAAGIEIDLNKAI